MNAKIETYGVTDIGNQRSSNQDQFLSVEVRCAVCVDQCSLDDTGESPNNSSSTPAGTLLVVADGMGGHANGGHASELAIRLLHQYVNENACELLAARTGQSASILDHLTAAFRLAHDNITTIGADDPDSRGMGTTLTAAYVQWPRLYLAHAGDSRCYLLRDGQLAQLTTDHTLARLQSERVTGDDEPPAEETDAPGKLAHVLYNCLGGDADALDVETREIELQAGDEILLCTDGLTKHVDSGQTAAILTEAPSLPIACSRLVLASKQAGGTDNITAVAARCPPGARVHRNGGLDKSDPLPERLPRSDSTRDTIDFVPAVKNRSGRSKRTVA